MPTSPDRSTWWLRDTGRPFDDGNVIYSKTVADAVDFVAAFFGIAPAVDDDAQRADRRPSSRAQRRRRGRTTAAPTNLLTMVMLAPEFHMA